MFGLTRPHAGEIPLSALGSLPQDGFELARLWLSPGEGRMYVSISRHEEWAPKLVGSLLVECARTAAASFARNRGLSEDDAYSEILEGMDEERVRLSGFGD